MRRFAPGVLALSLLLAAANGCDTSTTVPDPAGDGAPDKVILSGRYLTWLWNLSDATDYTVVSGTVSVAQGGTFVAHGVGWTPPQLECRVEVPPDAIPEWADIDGDGLFTISIYIPQVPQAPPANWVPVYKLGPEGIQFLEDVQVTFVYPETLAPVRSLRVFCLVPGPTGLKYSDLHWRESLDDEPVWSLTFPTRHFSRWPFGEGKGP